LSSGRILVIVVVLATGGSARGQAPDQCTGRNGDYVVWNFSQTTSTLFEQKEIEAELGKIQEEAAQKLGYALRPPLTARDCKNAALQKKLETRDHLTDLESFLLVGLTAKGKAFEVHIIPYLVSYKSRVASDPIGLITNWECQTDGPSPSVNERRSVIRAYVYAALALAELRLLESQRDPCRVRQAQFYLERALSAVSRRPLSTGSDPLAVGQLQEYLEAKRGWLKPFIEAAAQSAGRCAMPIVSSRLPQLLPQQLP
jgi:hypothetical protein